MNKYISGKKSEEHLGVGEHINQVKKTAWPNVRRGGALGPVWKTTSNFDTINM